MSKAVGALPYTLKLIFPLPRLEGLAEIFHFSGLIQIRSKMSDEVLSEEVKALLLRHIGSVAHLEALLFLRTHPEYWDPASLAKRLYFPQHDMLRAVVDLHRDGLLAAEEGLYRYDPPANYQGPIVALADAYTRHLVPVTNFIHDGRRHIRAFSDAFRLRKDS